MTVLHLTRLVAVSVPQSREPWRLSRISKDQPTADGGAEGAFRVQSVMLLCESQCQSTGDDGRGGGSGGSHRGATFDGDVWSGGWVGGRGLGALTSECVGQPYSVIVRQSLVTSMDL